VSQPFILRTTATGNVRYAFGGDGYTLNQRRLK
jgi:hypothetical protein